MTKDAGLGLADKEVIQCFGLSKMTIYKEIGQREKY